MVLAGDLNNHLIIIAENVLGWVVQCTSSPTIWIQYQDWIFETKFSDGMNVGVKFRNELRVLTQSVTLAVETSVENFGACSATFAAFDLQQIKAQLDF